MVSLGTTAGLENLASVTEKPHIFPVRYAYDYLRGELKYLNRPQLMLNDHLRSRLFLKLAASNEEQQTLAPDRNENAIDIKPLDAALPWATGITSCRQSKHWKVSVETAQRALIEVATSDYSGIRSKTGHSIADISNKEIRSNVEEGWAKFPVYLFSGGDEEVTRLLAIINVFIFVFDDFWEAVDISGFSQIQETFIRRMQPHGQQDREPAQGGVQTLIDAAIAGILEIDKKNNNDIGKEMIELMVRFFTRPAPATSYGNLREFLLYRHEDAAVPYVLGCTKFALNNSVDLDSPRIAKYLGLFKDHVSIANDLGSWEKEKRAFDTGKVLYLINTVAEVKQLLQLSNYEAAVAVTQGLQFQVESEIDAEIKNLIDTNSLTANEWRFVDATLHVMSGNVLVSTVMSRYGGEETKL